MSDDRPQRPLPRHSRHRAADAADGDAAGGATGAGTPEQPAAARAAAGNPPAPATGSADTAGSSAHGSARPGRHSASDEDTADAGSPSDGPAEDGAPADGTGTSERTVAADQPHADGETGADADPHPAPTRRLRLPAWLRLPARLRSRRGQQVALGVVAAAAVAVLVLSLLDLIGGGSTTRAAPATTGPTSTTSAVLADPDAASAFLSAATADISAVTTFGYTTLDTDSQAGRAVTTGAYRTAYTNAVQGSFGSLVRTSERTQTFAQQAIGIGATSADGTSAKVLVFGVQTITDLEPSRTTTSSVLSLTATVVRSGSSYLISQLSGDANAGLPAGSPALEAAAEAGRIEVVDMLTLRRSSAAADLAAALSHATGAQRAALEAAAPARRARVAKGGADTVGAVPAVAAAAANGTTDALRVVGTSTPTTGGTASVGRYVVGVVRAGDGWLVDQVSAVGAS